MTVGELIRILQTYPMDRRVMILTDDGNGHCHDEPEVLPQSTYTLSIGDRIGGPMHYEEVHEKIVEIR